MDTAHIPKTFWHSLSFCMVIGTVGLLLIAYKASSVSFEIANTKIVLASAISETKEIRADLDAESKKLLTANRELQEKIDSFKKSGAIEKGAIPLSEINKIWEPFVATGAQMKLKSIDSKLDTLDTKIQSAQDAIKK